MEEKALAEWVAAEYDVDQPVVCSLLRDYTNTVYLVESGTARFVLKVYGRDWRTEGEIRYEIALIQHLKGKGALVAVPVAARDNEIVREVVADNERRCAVLFEYAPGEKPQPPFTPPLYEAFGEAIAQAHELSSDFVTDYPRRSLDINFLIEEPLALALPLLETQEQRTFLRGLANQVSEKIQSLALESLDWGPIHGDATLDNLHVTAEGEIILYDFDSGGPGWRAMDLPGWAIPNPDYKEIAAAFLQGYSRVRSLKEADIRIAPCLTIALDIWGIQIDLEQRILRQGTERTRIYLTEQIAALRERERIITTRRVN